MRKKIVFKSGERVKNNEGDFCTVLSDGGWDSVNIQFDSGYRQVSTRQQLSKGSVKDRFKRNYFGVGFIGGSEYKTKGKTSFAYSVWKLMLERCYGSSEKFKTYNDCTVCDDWHNFQNFSRWYELNTPKDGLKYEIDKDLLVYGNKIYSPETCIMLTHQENCEVSFSKVYKMRSPEGKVVEIYNMVKFCRENNLSHGNMFTVLSGKRKHHKGWESI